MLNVHYFFHFVKPEIKTNNCGLEMIISKLNFDYKIDNFDGSIFIYTKRNLNQLGKKFKIQTNNGSNNVFTVIPKQKYCYQYQVFINIYYEIKFN